MKLTVIGLFLLKGSGIPNIFTVWNKQGWPAPKIEESYEPERITLLLHIDESSDNDKKVAIKSSDNDKKVAIKSSDNDKKATLKSQLQKETIIAYLTEKVVATTKDIAELLGVKEARARRLLAGMIEADIVLAEGANRNRIYKLKQ